MNAARGLVCSLLVGCIVAGFIQGLPMENALAVMTSYSTWTSTYTSHRYVTTGTETVWTVTSLGVLTQTAKTGPYAKFDVRYAYIYDPGGQNVVGFHIQGWIENLMNVRLEGGTIRTLWTNKAETVKETLDVNFGEIEPRKMIYVDQEKRLTTSLREGDLYLYVGYLIRPKGSTSIAIATYTQWETQTDTYLRTYTTAYTMSEPLAPPTVPMLPLLVLVGIAIGVLLLFVKKRSRVTQRELQAPPLEFRCAGCGVTLQAGEDFCPNCGRKRE